MRYPAVGRLQGGLLEEAAVADAKQAFERHISDQLARQRHAGTMERKDFQQQRAIDLAKLTKGQVRKTRRVGPEDGQLQPFVVSCVPTGMHGPACISWADLTPFLLQDEITHKHEHIQAVRAGRGRLRALGVPRQIDSARRFYIWYATAERSFLIILGLGSCSSRRCRRAGR